MSYCTSPYSSLIKNRAAESTSPQTHRTSFNGTEEKTTRKGPLRPENYSKLRRSERLATRHARPEETHRRKVVGIGRLYHSQTGDTSFQETKRRRGRSTSAVAGRSLQLFEFEKLQRRYDLIPHGDRCLHESGLVCSAE